MELKMILDKNTFNVFGGGWSYLPEELFSVCLEANLETKQNIKVLEFGCGDSTIKFFNILKSIQGIDSVEYDCYESNSNFLIRHETINCNHYDENNIDDVILNDKKYDIVLVDGPNGVNRYKWYKKINDAITDGSVILIDDYDHYIEFETYVKKEVESNWNCVSSVESKNDPASASGKKTWKLLKILNKK